MGKDQELLEAARNGNVVIVEKILGQRAKRSGPLASLRRGPGANVQDSSGYSALHHAALNGHKDVVKLLLQYEASTNIVDTKGSSPLHLAAWSGNSEIVRLILSQGPSVPNVNLTTKDNETALHCAAQYGHTEVVAQLLQHGCDPSIRNSRGESALDLAAQYGRLETVELLVRTHSELIESLRSSSSSLIFPHTPLHLASRNGHRACVEVLLAAGVYVNIRTSAGTAMHEAALCGKMEVVRTLLDRGVDLAIKDSRHNTVLDLLGQFPAHVTQDITAVITRHQTSSGIESDANIEYLPPIPIQSNNSLGSPYENVRSADEYSPGEGSSPTRWQLYYKPRDDHRQVSANSAKSLGSNSGLHQTPSIPHTLIDISGDYLSSQEQLSLILPSAFYEGRESDQLSLSSSSSIGGPSPRERCYLPSDSSASGIYLPMASLSSSIHSPLLSSKVSNGCFSSTLQPAPPKKPPRRNLSVSPTHLQTEMSLSTGSHIGRKDYDYLFLAHSGPFKWTEIEPSQERSKHLCRVYHSVDQYVDMKSHQEQLKNEVQITNCGEIKVEPVAITYINENRSMRITNPRRKLRRYEYERSAYENYEIDSNPTGDKSPCNETVSTSTQEKTLISNTFFRVKSSLTKFQPEVADKILSTEQIVLPTSPTHYLQPPTPDHPPPSALQAEKSIHECIRPLSQVYKRRSRDMETEMDEDLLQFPASGLISSVSLSDKSVSMDNVEEYFGDVPFAGLLKGSVLAAERPCTLRRLRNVYSSAGNSGSDSEMGTGTNVLVEQEFDQHEVVATELDREQQDDKMLNLMSPFDEQEEWAKISEIMASFSTGLLRESVFMNELEKEFQARLGLNPNTSNQCVLTLVNQWLSKFNLADYESLFINYGFDDLEFINGVLDEMDLKEMGINSDEERTIILDAVSFLDNHMEKHPAINVNQTVDEWLKSIHLENYAELFRRHLYTDMERVRRVWEVELAAVLEIQKPAHRKRILVSVNSGHTSRSTSQVHNSNCLNLEDLNKDLNTLKTNIQQLKDEIRDKLSDSVDDNTSSLSIPTTTGSTITMTVIGKNVTSLSTLKHRKNRPAPEPPQKSNADNRALQASDHLEIRGPSELLFGIPSTLKTQWRHQPEDLVTGSITYVANYLGSTVVKELRGTESTKKSIQKLKKISRDPRTTPDITLSISYRGVFFLNTLTDEPICEHEIRNIHCACQDADDLTHFAYITKDHASRTHFCHVFCVSTMDQATEIILTLGQAFEIAYQIALKDKLGSHVVRSQSVNKLTSLMSSKLNCPTAVKVTEYSLSQKDYHNNELNNHKKNLMNSRSKPRSKSITNTFCSNYSSSNIDLNIKKQRQQSKYQVSNSNKSLNILNSHSNFISKHSNSNSKSIADDHSIRMRLLATHGRSHSVNDIKINGNQLKLTPAPVDDIGIGIKGMKAGSRAPFILSEKL